MSKTTLFVLLVLAVAGMAGLRILYQGPQVLGVSSTINSASPIQVYNPELNQLLGVTDQALAVSATPSASPADRPHSQP